MDGHRGHRRPGTSIVGIPNAAGRLPSLTLPVSGVRSSTKPISAAHAGKLTQRAAAVLRPRSGMRGAASEAKGARGEGSWDVLADFYRLFGAGKSPCSSMWNAVGHAYGLLAMRQARTVGEPAGVRCRLVASGLAGYRPDR
jgi:hypothetical protein